MAETSKSVTRAPRPLFRGSILDQTVRSTGLAVLLCLIAAAPGNDARAQSIVTIAGQGTDEGLPVEEVIIEWPNGIAFDQNGHLIVSDRGYHRIRRYVPESGVRTLAGRGIGGFGGDGGPATLALLNEPHNLAVLENGEIYVADRGNDRVRRIDIDGIITTVAGGGTGGDGSLASEARLSIPYDVAFDHDGNLLIMDNTRVKRVERSTGRITTIAGNGQQAYSGDGGPAIETGLQGVALTVGPDGDIFVAEHWNHRIRRIDSETGIISTFAGVGTLGFAGDGGPATQAQFHSPADLDFDPEGNLYIADLWNDRVRRVDAETGVITTFAHAATLQAGSQVFSVEVGPDGHVYFGHYGTMNRVDPDGSIVTVAGRQSGGRFTGDGGPATAALVDGPRDIIVGPENGLFIADTGNRRIRRIDLETGIITTYAGGGDTVFDGAQATSSEIFQIPAIGLDANGNILFADCCRVRRVDRESGTVSTIAGIFGRRGYSGDEGPATRALLHTPSGMTADPEGNIYIADYGNQRIRRVSAATGVITTYAGNGVIKEGDSLRRGSFSGDGGPATEAGLDLLYSAKITMDPDENLLIADNGNNRIRRVNPEGIIETIAGGGSAIADGVPALEAELQGPNDVVLDSAGNMYVAGSDYRIRKIDAETGLIDTVTGRYWIPGYGGDHGPALYAQIDTVLGIALDGENNLYLAGLHTDLIRAIFACVKVSGPELVSPADGSSGVGTAPVLAWAQTESAFDYHVFLSTENPPERSVATDLEGTSLSLSNLEPLTTYYWGVLAVGDPWCRPIRAAGSEFGSFTTASQCQPPSTADQSLEGD